MLQMLRSSAVAPTAAGSVRVGSDMRGLGRDGLAVDRHANRIADLRIAVLESPGASGPDVRLAAASGQQLPPPLQDYAVKVRDSAWRITDADIAALIGAGRSEDEIFEVTVAAAVGAALRSLASGIDLLQERPEDAPSDA
jgi:hypothetical protein